MIHQAARIIRRQQSHILEDFIGVTAIFIVVFVGLSIPS